MWSDTVTIYRKTGDEVERIVVNDCCFEVKMEEGADILGPRHKGEVFLAVKPGAAVQVGDRVIRGVGPALGWEALEPARAQGLVELRRVAPCYLHGVLHHTEAFG